MGRGGRGYEVECGGEIDRVWEVRGGGRGERKRGVEVKGVEWHGWGNLAIIKIILHS